MVVVVVVGWGGLFDYSVTPGPGLSKVKLQMSGTNPVVPGQGQGAWQLFKFISRHFVHLQSLSEFDMQSLKIFAFDKHQENESILMDPVAITDNFVVIEAGSFTSFQVNSFLLLYYLQDDFVVGFTKLSFGSFCKAYTIPWWKLCISFGCCT